MTHPTPPEHPQRVRVRGLVALVVVGLASIGAGTSFAVDPGDRSTPDLELAGDVASADTQRSETRDPPRGADTTSTTAATAATAGERSTAAVATGVDVADPTVLADDGGYVLVGTNIVDGDRTQHLPAATSTDLIAWSATFDLLPELPSWASTGFTWAPSLTRDGSEYQLYFAARHTESQRQCIGVATSDRATGPFRSDSAVPLVCQIALGGSIDPDVVTIDGERWLMWKNDGNCCGITTTIWVQRLDGTRLVGSADAILSADARWEGGVIENPSALVTGSTTLVLYSANDWTSGDYGTGAATCVGGWLGCEKRSRAATLLPSEAGTAGSGGASFFEDADGRPRIAWHAWRTGVDGVRVRTVFIDTVDRLGL